MYLMKLRSAAILVSSIRGLFRVAPVALIGLAMVVSACSGAALVPPVATAAIPVTGATDVPTQAAATQAATADQSTPTTAAATQAQPAAATAAATLAATPVPSGGTATGPKAYIGLFKDNAVAVFDTGANKLLSTIPIPTGPHGLVITPDGKTVFASSDGDSKVSMIDTATDKVVNTIDVGKSPHGLAITPDGSVVLVADFGTSQVVKLDAKTGMFIDFAPVPSPHNIAISPDGLTAYVASQDAKAPSLVVLKLDKLSPGGAIALPKVPRALNFSPDGKLLYFTEAGIDAVQVLDPATNKITGQVAVGASPHHPLFTPDGMLALVVSQGPGTLSLIDPMSNAVSKVVKVGTMPHWIAVNAQGTTAWVTNEASNDLSVVDLANGTVTATIPVGNAPRKIVVQPQGGQAAQSTPAGGASSNTSGAASGNAVAIQAMAFATPALTVKVGQTVTWTNMDTINHTVTADQGAWDSGPIAPGKTFSFTFTQAGSFGYHCSIHPFMQGMVMVTS
jgi:YVTN family beta-propeller protein